MLTEQAGDVAAWWCECLVHGAGNQHLHHRAFRPPVVSGVEPGLVHVLQAGPNDDPRLVTKLKAVTRQARESGKFGQGDVHPKRPGPTAVSADATKEFRIQGRFFDQIEIQKLRIDVGHH